MWSILPYPEVNFFIKSSLKYWNENLWKYEVDMLKIIVIIVGYTLNGFITHITIL
jgi:hypothetical protein